MLRGKQAATNRAWSCRSKTRLLRTHTHTRVRKFEYRFAGLFLDWASKPHHPPPSLGTSKQALGLFYDRPPCPCWLAKPYPKPSDSAPAGSPNLTLNPLALPLLARQTLP